MIFHLVLKVFYLILLQLKENLHAKNECLACKNFFNPISVLKIVDITAFLSRDNFLLEFVSTETQQANLFAVLL